MIAGFAIFITLEQNVVSATNTWYVGGPGPGNFSTIQAAIDFANPGDTVYVFPGTYYENVVVNKTINLTGANPLTTIIDGQDIDDVIYVNANWVNITRFKLIGFNMNADSGIELYNAQNCRITNNNISSNPFGISLKYSSNNIITDNIISTLNGINLEYSDSNNITDNEITTFDKQYGIYIWYSSNITLIGNNIAPGGVYLLGDQLFHYNTHNISTSNLINGEPLYYYKNETGINIDGIPVGQLILANCTDFDVRNLQIHKTPRAIDVAYSTNITIIGNNVSDNSIGISLFNSNYNKINGNNASYDNAGVMLIFSSNNDIRDNILLYHGKGISLSRSLNNSILSNNVSYNGRGISVYESSYSFIADNTAMENSIGIRVWRSTNSTVKNNNVYLNERGILIRRSDDNIIKNNTAFSNYLRGIMLERSSSNNHIKNNNITSNEWGIYLESSSSLNRIYHNNFLNNTNQAYDEMNNNFWNDSYPSGGNYWSDYTGVDFKRGSNQDIPGSDGIGDTPYIDIRGAVGNQDFYPLIEPNNNYILLYPGWNLISIPFTQEDQNLTKVFERIDGYYDAVQLYDINDTNKPWKHNNKNKDFGNDLFKINETMGIWIHNNQSEDLMFLYNGTQPTVNQTIQLYIGWNLVGFPSLTTYNRTVGLNNLEFGSDVDVIQWYDGETKTWHDVNQEEYFVLGRGYWIHSKVESLWDVPL